MTYQVNNQSIIPSGEIIELTLTLKMTTAQVVETRRSVTVNKNRLQYSSEILKHLCDFPLPNVDFGLQSSQCSKIRVAQHWGRRGVHLIENKGVKSECMKFGENSRQMSSVSTICDEYCSPIRDYVHLDHQTSPTFEMTPGLKPFIVLTIKYYLLISKAEPCC